MIEVMPVKFMLLLKILMFCVCVVTIDHIRILSIGLELACNGG